jgi:hypothetical protein
VARPFVLQYLIFCESVEYLDPARPHRDSVLNRVDYVLSAPPGTEFPFEPVEFWLFARFYWLRDRPERHRRSRSVAFGATIRAEPRWKFGTGLSEQSVSTRPPP